MLFLFSFPDVNGKSNVVYSTVYQLRFSEPGTYFNFKNEVVNSVAMTSYSLRTFHRQLLIYSYAGFAPAKQYTLLALSPVNKLYC